MSSITPPAPWRSRSPRLTVGLLWAVLGASVLIPALLFGLAAWQSREQALRDAARSAERISQSIQQHAQNVFDTIRVTMDRIDDRVADMSIDAMRHSWELHAFLRRVDEELAQIGTIVLADADGMRIASSTEFNPASPVNLADRDYMKALKAGHAGMYVGETVLGRRTGQVQVILARSLRSPEGVFRGALVVSVTPSYFVDFFQKIAPGMNYSAALVRSDGLFVIRDAVARPSTDQPRASANFLRAVQAGETTARWTGVSAVDGVRRITVMHKLDGGLPVFSLFALGTDAVLAHWRAQVWHYALFALLATLGLVALSALALARTRREQQSLAVLRDEMARRESAEAKLVQTQKLEALGRIAGSLAHDINNLNQVILGNLDMLRRAGEDRRGRLIDNAMQAVRQGTRITSQLLAFGRKQALRPELTDLNALIAGMDDMLAQSLRGDIRLELAYGPDLRPVEIDQAQFQVALINLALNARDAMPDGGVLRIETGNGKELRGTVTGSVTVTISDTGEGMPPDVLARAGEPFFSTKAKVGRGTGLGLAQVFGFVQQSGGHVDIRSDVGVGTVITLTLPQAKADVAPTLPEPLAEAREPAVAGHAGLAPLVLLVDDNLQVAEVAAAVLAEAGYRVCVVHDGARALQELEAARFALLFSDLVMSGMSGLELAREARRLRPDLPVLLATGYSDAAQSAIREGYDVVAKPYHPAILLAAVGRLIACKG